MIRIIFSRLDIFGASRAMRPRPGAVIGQSVFVKSDA